MENQAAAVASGGAVTVTENLPAGLSLVSMTASPPWNCSSNTCTRSDALAGGAGYSPITVTVNVASSATSPLTNHATVSGGNSSSATATDLTNIVLLGCDVNNDSSFTVADVQAMVSGALGSTAVHDLNNDGVVNVVDIQIVINAVLNMGCIL